MADMKNAGTKFVLSMLGLVTLFISTLVGKFSGDFAFATVSIVVTYVTGNAFITGKALANGNGKHRDPA